MPRAGFAQGCGTLPPTPQQAAEMDIVYKAARESRGTGSFRTGAIPVNFWIIANAAGEVAIADYNNRLDQELAIVNQDFVPVGFSFFRCKTEVIKTLPNFFSMNYSSNILDPTTNIVSDPRVVLYNGHHTSDGINVYIVQNILGYGGVAAFSAYPTGNGNNNTNLIVIKNFQNHTLTHELGHYFNVLHTDEPVKQTINGMIVYISDELVNGTNCSTTGDKLCGTPADPGPGLGGLPYCNNNTCNNVCDLLCKDNLGLGMNYTPDKANFMSNYNSCRSHFSQNQTPNQVSVMQQSLQTTRSFLLSASCTPTFSNAGLIERPQDCPYKDPDDAFLKPSLPIGNVKVTISNSQGILCNPLPITNDAGQYYSCSIPLNDLITIAPHKNNDWTNGVDDYDAFLLQQHVLGTTPLQTYYHKIAGDMNNSATLTTFDAVLIRRVAGKISFPTAVESYRFVPNYFLNPKFGFVQSLNANPFTACWTGLGQNFCYSGGRSYLDGAFMNTGNSDALNPNNWGFVSIKMGDLSCSAIKPLERQSQTTTTKQLAVQDTWDYTGNETEVVVAVKSNNLEKLVGYQLGLSFDKEKVEVLKMIEGTDNELDVLHDIALEKKEDGKIRVSRIGTKYEKNAFKEGEALFYVKLRLREETTNINDLIRFDDEVLKNEFYAEEGNLLENDLKLEIVDAKEMPTQATQIANKAYPNPFKDELVVQFELQKPSKTRITVKSVYGNLIDSFTGDFPVGVNEFKFDTSNYPDGMLFYTIQSNNSIFNGNIVKESK
jgi:hypothetical protein